MLLLAAALPLRWQLLWLVLPAWGVVFYLHRLWLAWQLRRRGLAALARITAYQRGRGARVKVFFVTHLGQQVEASNELVYSTDPEYTVGDEVALRYEARRPGRFLLEGQLTARSIWVVAGFAFLFAVLLLAASLPLLEAIKQLATRS